MSESPGQVSGLANSTEVFDADGQSLGRIRHVYDSDQAGDATWVTIDSDGHPDRRHRFVPLEGARLDGSDLRLPYPGSLIDSSPEVTDDAVIDSTRERQLRAHYGLDAGDTSGTGGLIRSEERLTVGTTVQARERVVVQKVIVTEEVTHTFTLRREEIRVLREPLDGSRSAGQPSALSNDVTEIVLHAEVPTFSTEVVPVETVRVSKYIVTGEETISADLKREHIDLDEITYPPEIV